MGDPRTSRGLSKIQRVMAVLRYMVHEGHCSRHYWPQGGGDALTVYLHLTKFKEEEAGQQLSGPEVVV